MRCNPCALLVDMWFGIASMGNGMMVPKKKIKNRNTIWSRIYIYGYISRRNEIRISKRYLHPLVQCSIIHNNEIQKEPTTTYMSFNRWMDKDVTHKRKKEIPSLATIWMDLEGITLSEINWRQHCMLSLTGGTWNGETHRDRVEG